MSILTVPDLLQRLLDRGMTQRQIADALEMAQGSVSRMASGQQKTDYETYLKIAALAGVGPGTEGVVSSPTPVGVYGTIGAGGAIDTSSEQIEKHDPLFTVEVPFPLPDDALAFQVKGESMWPKYDDGDVVVCSKFNDQPDGLIDFPACVETEDGKRYLKRVLKGTRPGHFHLESYNAPLMPDVRVVGFRAIIATVPVSQVRFIESDVKRNIHRQIKSGRVLRS